MDSPETPRPLGEVTYQQLRRIAAARFRGQGPITLQPTALVHEAWEKISAASPEVLSDRNHFLSLAARAMRQILIDQARARGAQKRGGGQVQVSLSGVAAADEAVGDVLALDTALTELAEVDPRRAGVVELRFFGGLTVPEVAEATGSSVATVERDWRAARAWLQARLSA